ncbi:MAG: hypothetical protein WAW88_09510 [Nocardioides sp.]
MVASLTQAVDTGEGVAVAKTNAYTLDPAGRIDARAGRCVRISIYISVLLNPMQAMPWKESW